MLRQVARCDLCELPLPQQPVLKMIDGEQRQFCCDGCARVYEVARDSGMLEDVLRSARGRTKSDARPSFLQPRESAFFDIDGMWCAGCALAAERVLRNQSGVKDASVSFAAERGRIEYDPGQVNPDALMQVLAPLGYQARITSTKERQQKERA